MRFPPPCMSEILHTSIFILHAKVGKVCIRYLHRISLQYKLYVGAYYINCFYEKFMNPISVDTVCSTPLLASYWDKPSMVTAITASTGYISSTYTITEAYVYSAVGVWRPTYNNAYQWIQVFSFNSRTLCV